MGFRPRVPYATVLSRLGLTTNLKLVLDAGDVASWPGSGQKWLDTAGSGYDFHLGTSSSSESQDPTFSGTAGGLSTSDYWDCDTNAVFTYDSANETWMNNIHKDGAVFTILAWVYITNVGASSSACVCGTLGNGANVGFQFQLNAGSGALRIQVGNGSGVTSFLSGGSAPAINTWNLVGLAISENAGASGGQFYANGAVNGSAFNPNYSSPSSANATYTMQVAGDGNNLRQLGLNGAARIAALMFWEGRALTADEILRIYNATQSPLPWRPRTHRFFTRRR